MRVPLRMRTPDLEGLGDGGARPCTGSTPCERADLLLLLPVRYAPDVEPIEPEQERAALEALAAFAAELGADDFVAGHWLGGERREDGVLSFPMWLPGEVLGRFTDVCYRLGWVTPAFDWTEWIDRDENQALLEDPSQLGTASLDDLQRVLTATIRGERFSEGSLAAYAESGLLQAVAERARALLDERASD
jgi:hypothetical protein